MVTRYESGGSKHQLGDYIYRRTFKYRAMHEFLRSIGLIRRYHWRLKLSQEDRKNLIWKVKEGSFVSTNRKGFKCHRKIMARPIRLI